MNRTTAVPGTGGGMRIWEMDTEFGRKFAIGVMRSNGDISFLDWKNSEAAAVEWALGWSNAGV